MCHQSYKMENPRYRLWLCYPPLFLFLSVSLSSVSRFLSCSDHDKSLFLVKKNKKQKPAFGPHEAKVKSTMRHFLSPLHLHQHPLTHVPLFPMNFCPGDLWRDVVGLKMYTVLSYKKKKKAIYMVDGKMFFKIKCLRLQNANKEEREIETNTKKREGQVLRLFHGSDLIRSQCCD